MNKKLMIYGLAFGSVAATLTYLYYVNKIYNSSNLAIIINVIELFIIPIIAIWLFNKSVKRDNPEQFILGRMIFLGFFISVLIAACTSMMYSYIHQFYSNYINEFIQFKYTGIEKMAKEQNKSLEELNNFKSNIKAYYSVRQQLSSSMFLAASRGILFSALIAYLMKAKMNKTA